MYHLTQLKCCQHSNVECVCTAVPLNTVEMLSTQQYVCTAVPLNTVEMLSTQQCVCSDVPLNTVEMLSTQQCGMCMYCCTT